VPVETDESADRGFRLEIERQESLAMKRKGDLSSVSIRNTHYPVQKRWQSSNLSGIGMIAEWRILNDFHIH
jgi:hypothetical protein